jgi:hypothetical protein
MSTNQAQQCWSWGGVLRVAHLIGDAWHCVYKWRQSSPHKSVCGVVLGLTTISKMVSEPPQDPLGHLLSGFCYRTTHHLCPWTKPNCAGREGVCKSPTSDRRWSDNVFISEGNPHLTCRFCGVVLSPTTISKRNISSTHDELWVKILRFNFYTIQPFRKTTKI